jgi:hypothetical protein
MSNVFQPIENNLRSNEINNNSDGELNLDNFKKPVFNAQMRSASSSDNENEVSSIMDNFTASRSSPSLNGKCKIIINFSC